MLTLTNSMPGLSESSCSRIGCTARHGPHQGAQKSTTTGPPAWRTSRSKLSSVTSRIAQLYPPEKTRRPQRRHLPDRLRDDRLRHLRRARLAVDERDRDLDDSKAGANRTVG